MHHGSCPAQIDHINQDKADNRIENLRPADHSTNQVNTRDRTESRGVRKRGNQWEARVWKDGKGIRVGLFKTKEQAIEACNGKRRELFGAFAE